MTAALSGDYEILDVVNEQDQVVGQARRSEVYAKKLPFRVVYGLIENDKGQLWIPRRTESKKVCPGALDMSVAGHVAAGETYEQGFRREAQEEIFLDVDTVSWSLLGSLNPFKDGSYAFSYVYKIKMNESPEYNKSDYSDFYWLTPQELMQRLDSGEAAKNDLPLLLRIFYKDFL